MTGAPKCGCKPLISNTESRGGGGGTLALDSKDRPGLHFGSLHLEVKGQAESRCKG